MNYVLSLNAYVSDKQIQLLHDMTMI